MKNKAYSVFTIKSTSEDGDGKRTFKGIATTPTPDRAQDVMDPKGAEFELPMPFLWQHDILDPVGWITKAKVTAAGIDIEGEVADIKEEGRLKDRLTEAWQMLKTKLVRGLSVGFNPVEWNWIDGTDYGMHILKWAWLELSAVTIPCNIEANITTIKAASSRKILPSVVGKKLGGIKVTLQEQLAQLAEAKAVKLARLEELTGGIKAKTAGAEDVAEFDQLTGEIEGLDNDIRLKRAEIVTAGTAVPVKSYVKTAPTILIKKEDAADKFKGQAYTRLVIAKALANLDGISPLAIAQKRWGRSNPMLVDRVKADVAGGGSGSGEWGAELVAADARYTGDFISFLTSKTVFDRLGLREVPANVQIKGQDGTATGYWVGQSKAIPASGQSFSAVNLTPLKVAAIAVISNELLRDSTPAAEQLIRDALIDASAQRIDGTFLSATAASAGVSPAGVLNGLSAIASEGVDAAGVRADIKALYASFITAKNASGLKLVMNPALAKGIQLLVNALGLVEFAGINQDGGTLLGDVVVTGDNVNANHMMLLKPSDIYRIGDMGIQVSISREAMIEQGTTPTGATDTPVAASEKFTSMFQSESTAIKIVRPVNFQLRRAGVVQYIDDADYGASS